MTEKEDEEKLSFAHVAATQLAALRRSAFLSKEELVNPCKEIAEEYILQDGGFKADNEEIGSLLSKCLFARLAQGSAGWAVELGIVPGTPLLVGTGKTLLEAVKSAMEKANG